MAFDWNDNQKEAISHKGKGIVVSAAAGSGKTAVLVERIIRRICDPDDSAGFDNFLIVTFTKAAAGEMNQRLRDKLNERIEQNPTDRYMITQKRNLPLAHISSIDSYLYSLVKDNFHKLGVSPDFRITDGSEEKLILQDAFSETADSFYEENTPEFNRLLDIVGRNDNDRQLYNIVNELNDYADSHVEPEKWLDALRASYSVELSVDRTVFGKALLDRVRQGAEYAVLLLDTGIKLTYGYEGLEAVNGCLEAERKQAVNVLSLAGKAQWDELKSSLSTLRFVTFPTNSTNKDLRSSNEFLTAKAMRNRAKDVMNSLSSIMVADSEQFREDTEKLSPVVNELIRFIYEYRRALTEKKNEKNVLSFNDVTHLAVRLLVDPDGNPTETALEIRDRFDEILIDEYQDTNEAQDAIFRAISKDQTNLFLVGDVKQSVYGFRLATPYMFIDKIKNWRKEENSYAEYISLDENYRSRKEILDSVNYLFKKVMSEKIGDITYDEREALKPGFKEFPPSDKTRVEVDFVEKPGKSDNINEADFVAGRVKELLENETVYDKNLKLERPVKMKDICVLCRSNTACKRFATALNRAGISAHYTVKTGFFSRTEIKTVMSFLEILDNPLQDIPMLSVLMSPIFGFSPDDLARLRVEKRLGNIYYAIRESDSEKCRSFIEKYEYFRSLASVLTVSSLIREIYEQTGYETVVGALGDGEFRRMNLMLLLDYAASYEANSSQGLSGFVRYLERCRDSNADFEPATAVNENADVVRVMTIHKSKGLEFPIVILAGTGPSRKGSEKKLLSIDEKVGAGLKICERENFKTYETVQYKAAEILRSEREYSEEIRLLYVAMTRAMERLIVTAEYQNVYKRFGELNYAGLLEKVDPLEVIGTKTFADLIIKTYIDHRDADILRRGADFDIRVNSDPGFSMDFNVISETAVQENTETAVESLPDADPETVDIIRNKTEYKYPYSSLGRVSTKMAASAFNADDADTLRWFASEAPKFSRSEALTAAEKGTAMHRFMEVCDFSLAEENLDAEIERALREGTLTPQQAESLNRAALKKFFTSGVYGRIKASDRVLREQKFTVFVPLEFAEPGLENAGGEKVLVQGVIDCAFFERGRIVVLDYKTDRVAEPEELKQMYNRQLAVYKTAAEQSFGCEVSQLLLYSFGLGCEVEL